MSRRILLSAWLVLALVLLGGLWGPSLAQQARRLFQPPRLAVVDISEVFELYDKKRDRQAQFQAQINEAETKRKELEKRYKDILEDLKNLQAGPSKLAKEREKLELELEVKYLSETALKGLRETQFSYLKEIRDEIVAEIKVYAEAMDLDVVIEQKVMGEADGPNANGFSWPIVHFVKPELQITREIADRLNARYKP